MVGMDEHVSLTASTGQGDVSRPPTASFDALVQDQGQSLFSALRLLCHDRAEAEDMVQEAFLRVWERWDRVGSVDDPAGYLFRVALNLYRKRTRRAAMALRRSAVAFVRPPSDDLATVESRDEVLRALARLTPRQRMAVVLIDLLDYPSEEAARIMGIAASTVRVLASQGRAAVRREAGDDDG
jgi:RNA polymerase sigma-70 factor (ECF subfamily)